MKLKQQAQQGFTLIELMIVIAIVGILAAIALPAYQDYTVRAKISEPLAALSEAKTTVAEYYSARNVVPADQATAGIVQTRDASEIIDEIVYNVASSNPIITATVESGIIPGGTGLSFSLSGTRQTDGTIVWLCKPGDDSGSDPIETKFLPATCRG